jgi:hypothetical protein
VVRLEQRLGYVHKGVESLLAGATVERGARLVGRISGDSTVAYAWAFARAVEAALGWRCRRGRSCCAASWPSSKARPPYQRRRRHLQRRQRDRHSRTMRPAAGGRSGDLEGVLRSSADDGPDRARRRGCRPVGEGVGRDPWTAGATGATRAEIQRVYDPCRRSRIAPSRPASSSAALVRQYAAGGFVGRAAGRAFDARKTFAYSPYDELDFDLRCAPPATSMRACWSGSTR